ncbi:hypothetical protein PR202_gb10614 [Eleusine coracana subsp. coracana]|uniref:GTP-binding protein OBGC2 n=1 Tax=Eleusine coracana subsp. coracana TaxID=191504 RepID=A0AAV5EJZ5_ELECO|nr:hypothetical protein PR202_gb10614 [Eleusine coracana subsp. coracana]
MALLLHLRLPTQPLRAATQYHDAIPGCTHLLCPPSHARKQRPVAVTCRVARVKEAGVSAGVPPPPPQSLAKEAHKYFDHAVVTVRAGDGGHGAVLAMPPAPSADDTKRRGRFDRDRKKNKKPASYKRNYDGSVALPTGGHGGDVVVYADEAEETLLRFHEKARYCAKRGGNVGAAGGTLSSRMHNGFAGETLRIPVPVGTVVKRKKGTVLADLAHPGDEVLVARGGQGGVSFTFISYLVTVMQEDISLIDVPEYKRRKAMALSPNIMRDAGDKVCKTLCLSNVLNCALATVVYADEAEERCCGSTRRHGLRQAGRNVGAAGGTLSSRMHNGFAGETLRIPVPVGLWIRFCKFRSFCDVMTLSLINACSLNCRNVKRKKGTVLADGHPGDEVLVARGGQGGVSFTFISYLISLIDVPEYKRRKAMALSPNIMRDAGDKVLTHGQPGEEVSLELILRVVADVGLVGLPNAGKSTLLSAITLARPDIADYPFTTLMPNLGRLGGDPALGALQFSSEATLADLPGLIEGAHLGKGLGRNFLRHLRRTRVIVHVVDASADDPVSDYKIVREVISISNISLQELRMYNPQYLERPYVVVLNKIDLPKAHDRLSSLAFEISSIGCEEGHDRNASKDNLNENINEHQVLSESEAEGGEKELGDYPRPQAVVAASVLRHIGIDEMLKEIRAALRKCFDHKLPEP